MSQVEEVNDDGTDIELEQRDHAWLCNYVRKLETFAKQQLAINHKLYDDNVELSRKCKEHFDNAQKLMRYELKVPEQQEQLVRGITGTGKEFTVNRKTGELKLV